MALTRAFDLVPVNGALSFTEADWDKARFWLLEFQPAKRVALVGDPPNAIRVTGYGEDAEVAPGILARLCELAGPSSELSYCHIRAEEIRRRVPTLAS